MIEGEGETMPKVSWVIAKCIVCLGICYLYYRTMFFKYYSFSRRYDLKMVDRVANIERWLRRLSEVEIALLVFVTVLK